MNTKAKNECKEQKHLELSKKLTHKEHAFETISKRSTLILRNVKCPLDGRGDFLFDLVVPNWEVIDIVISFHIYILNYPYY